MSRSKTGKVWEGRFRQRPDPEFEAFSRSVGFDFRLAPYELEVDRVWASALGKVGIYAEEEVRLVHAALDELRQLLQAGRIEPLPSDEDVHVLIERLLTEKLGPVGERIHTGRSRNDLVVTDLKLYLRDNLAEILSALIDLGRQLLARSYENRDVLLPAYTHLQRAQPVSLSHYLLSLFWALSRTTRRLRQWLELHNTCPLGSGACAGSGFAIDREFVARSLGFREPTGNSVDAVASRDFVVDAVHICACLMSDLSRYAEDWILWSTDEFGFLTLDESLTTGSSLMPQKRNPDSLELIRGKSARVLAAETRLQFLLKAQPLTYNRDLQEDKEPVFDALDQSLASIRIFTKAVEKAQWVDSRMRQALDPALMATDLADYLVQKGLPFREAHRIVGRMILYAEEACKPLPTWDLRDFRRFCDRVDDDVFEWLRPEFSVRRRNLEGGTGPEAVARQIERAQQELEWQLGLKAEFDSLRIAAQRPSS
jgi:argininosuccinate lyase